MRYHRIRGVDLEVCTAEQKIAYNMAFQLHINFQDEFNRVKAENPGGAYADCLRLVQMSMNNYRSAYNYKPGRYDEDAISAALRAGLYGYLCKPFIATNYKEIGEAFPAHYL